jgi:tRNA A37 threonylcarbamoyladenosine dehydratase
MNEQEYVQGMLTRTCLYFSAEATDRVRNATMAIAGMGGVGAITVELLARWGVKKFRLLDLDKYEPTNLNRQLFATSSTLGQYKVDVAADRIKEINPHAEIEMLVKDMVHNQNAPQFVEGADIVIQNADRPSAKLLYNAARKFKIPLVNGYASLSGGRVQTFDFHNSECTSKLENWWNKQKKIDGKRLEDMTPEEVLQFDKSYVHSTAPSVNFVTNMVGCLIVAEAVKLLTGEGKNVLYPKYLEFDTFDFSMKVRNSLSPLDPGNIKRAKTLVQKTLGKE